MAAKSNHSDLDLSRNPHLWSPNPTQASVSDTKLPLESQSFAAPGLMEASIATALAGVDPRPNWAANSEQDEPEAALAVRKQPGGLAVNPGRMTILVQISVPGSKGFSGSSHFLSRFNSLRASSLTWILLAICPQLSPGSGTEK